MEIAFQLWSANTTTHIAHRCVPEVLPSLHQVGDVAKPTNILCCQGELLHEATDGDVGTKHKGLSGQLHSRQLRDVASVDVFIV